MKHYSFCESATLIERPCWHIRELENDKSRYVMIPPFIKSLCGHDVDLPIDVTYEHPYRCCAECNRLYHAETINVKRKPETTECQSTPFKKNNS